MMPSRETCSRGDLWDWAKALRYAGAVLTVSERQFFLVKKRAHAVFG